MVCQGHQRRKSFHLFSRTGLQQKSPSPIPIDLEINEAPEIPVENDLPEDVIESSIEPSPESADLESPDFTALATAEISGEEAEWDPLATEVIEIEEVLEDLTTDSSSLNPEQPVANGQEEETTEETTEITIETSSETEISDPEESSVLENESIDPIAESELEEEAIAPVTESELEEEAIVAEVDDTDADTESEETTDEETEDEDAEDTLIDIPLLLSDVVGGLGTVTDPSGQLSVTWKFDGGAYEGQVGVVSTAGLENYDLNSIEFMQEAIRRALDNIVVDDTTKGAEFGGWMNGEDSNHGEFAGVQTVQLSVGEQFFLALIPNGTFADILYSLEKGHIPTGDTRPLFSLATANPKDMEHFVQLVDLTGKGSLFALEDIRGDEKSDWDLNDIIITLKGAEVDAAQLDDLIETGVITEAPKWMETDLGITILESAIDDLWIEPEDLVTEKYEFPKEDQPLIGFIDTHLTTGNPDINYSNISFGKDWIENDSNPTVVAGEGTHADHILGIVAATQDNGLGIDGINDDAPLWVSSAVESGKWADALVEFVDAAIASNQPNAIINLSIDLTQVNPDGSVTTRYEFTPQERAAIEYARQSGVLIVAASGNDGGVMSVLGQASQEFDNIITVGAADGMARAAYSSYGYGLDIVAPGGSIDSPILSNSGDGLGLMAGTSVATAQVTGAASQVWAANPELSYRQVIEILKETATDINTPGWDAETGAGLLDMAAAVGLAKTITPDKSYDWRLDNLLDDEMSVNLDAAFKAALPNFGNESELKEEDINELTIEERIAYEKAIKEISFELNDYLARASQKIGLQYTTHKFGIQVEAMEQLLDVFDKEAFRNLVQAQDLLQRDGFSADLEISTLAIASNFNGIGGNNKFIPSERPVAIPVSAFNAQLLNVGYVSQVGYLRIRSGPGTNYPEIGRKYPGETVTFDAVENNGIWVPDPFIGGGGSSRWYKIAGTNQWMSALYFNNTPEQADQERIRQEAIRRAEEEAKLAEEIAQKAAKSAQLAAEAAQRALEDALRAAAIKANNDYWIAQSNSLPTPHKHIEYELIAKQLVYKDYKEGDEVRGYKVEKIFKQGDGLYAIGLVKDGQPPVLAFRGSQETIDWIDNTHPAGVGVGQYNNALRLGIDKWLKEKASKGTNSDVIGHSLGGALAQLTAADFSPWLGETVTFNAPGISPDRLLRFKGGQLTHYISPADIVSRGGWAFLPGQVYEMRFKGDLLQQHKDIFLSDPNIICIPVTKYEGSDRSLTWVGSRIFPEMLRRGIGIGLIGYHLSNDFNLGAYYSSQSLGAMNNAIKSGTDAAGSLINEGILALQKKAKEAKELADAAFRKVSEVRQVAQEKVQQAKVAYQNFKQETQKRVNEVIQYSQQKIQQVAQQVAQSIKNAVPKVAKAVTKFVQGAVNTVKSVINTGKQIVNNAINATKQVVNNIINTGKQVVNTVKTAVTNVYNSGVKMVSNTANNVKQAASNAINNVATGFNKFKSAFGF